MDFATQATSIGAGIGGFLNPILGGSTKTTTTTAPAEKTNTNTMVIVAIVVVVLIAAFFLLKPKNKTA